MAKDRDRTLTAATPPQEVASVWNWNNDSTVDDETVFEAPAKGSEERNENLRQYIIRKTGEPQTKNQERYMLQWIDQEWYFDDAEAGDEMTAAEIAECWSKHRTYADSPGHKKHNTIREISDIMYHATQRDFRRIVAFAREVADTRKR